MEIFRTVSEMQQHSGAWKKLGLRIGFVPTMGFLHSGHLSLVGLARDNSDRVVTSIFVNPKQFGPKEDLSRYPSDEKGDLAKLEEAGVDAVFIPLPSEIYPSNFQTTIHLSQLTRHLCGASRPGHFDGVATVVLKLFNIVQPDVVLFGEKDFQQLALIRQLVKDLNLQLQILGGAIVRTEEGLALSSRNSYLSEVEKKEAVVLIETIRLVTQAVEEGETDVKRLLELAEKKVLSVPSSKIDYLSIVHSETLEPIEKVEKPARFLLAVWIGKTRLIDNAPI